MLESDFQSKLIKELKNRFPGCEVLKNDSQYIQGVCDLIILFKNKWAMLEVKANINAKHRPNQDFYIKKYGEMSYAAFIYPENKEKILNELEQSFFT
jgi:Holliday junction resolvase-like predicted endonuclease